MTAKTVGSELAWQSPDGTRKIYKVTLDVNGQTAMANTYSEKISQVGWSGEVESYEKPGKGDFPAQTFVKQPQKEGGYGGGGRASRETDPFTMYLSYAKDLAIACVTEGTFHENLYAILLEAVEAGGSQLYESRPGAEQKAVAATPQAPPEPSIADLNSLFDEGGS
jgi:hypothetical protein